MTPTPRHKRSSPGYRRTHFNAMPPSNQKGTKNTLLFFFVFSCFRGCLCRRTAPRPGCGTELQTVRQNRRRPGAVVRKNGGIAVAQPLRFCGFMPRSQGRTLLVAALLSIIALGAIDPGNIRTLGKCLSRILSLTIDLYPRTGHEGHTESKTI